MKLKMTEFDEIYSEEYAEGTHVCTNLPCKRPIYSNMHKLLKTLKLRDSTVEKCLRHVL